MTFAENPIVQWVKWLLIFTVPWLAVLLFGGCGAPQYAVQPSKAENSIGFERSGNDVRVDARVGADTDATINDLKFTTPNGSSGSVGAVTYKANPSNSLTAQVAAMEAYRGQQETYYTGLSNVAIANWTGFTNAISAAAPIAGSYLDGLMKVNLAKAQRPGLVQQLSGLVLAGQTSTAALTQLGASPDITAEVERQVSLKIVELKAATQPAN